MKTIITTDLFEAVETETGVEISERKNASKKVGLMVTLIGLVMFALGWLDLTNLTFEWIAKFFMGVMFWGGLILIILGPVVLIVKGMQPPMKIVFDNEKQELHQKNKVIPYTDIDEVFIQSQPMMKKTMTIIMLIVNGKKKTFIPGSMFLQDDKDVVAFVDHLNKMMGKTVAPAAEEEIPELE